MARIRNVEKQSVKKTFSARKSKLLVCADFAGDKNTLIAIKTA